MDQFSNITFDSTIPNSSINSTTIDTSFYNHSTTSSGAGSKEIGLTLTTIVYVGLLGGIIFFALLGNLLVILVFLFDQRLRVSTSYYMLSLAVSDVITASLVMTLEVDQLINNKKWLHSRALCDVWTTAYLFTVPVSILTTCASSIDRWYAIEKPLKYRTGRNGLKHKALCAIILVWVCSILFALIPKMGWNPPGKPAGATPTDPYCYFDIKLEYSILSSVLNFILPSCITAIFYYYMFKAMKKHTIKRRKLSSASEYTHRSPSQRSDDHKKFLRNVNLAKSYAMIGSLLFITWGPFSTFSIITNVCSLIKSAESCFTNRNRHIDLSLLMLGYFNSAVNPVVYVLRFRAFRVKIQDWFCTKKRCMESHYAKNRK